MPTSSPYCPGERGDVGIVPLPSFLSNAFLALLCELILPRAILNVILREERPKDLSPCTSNDSWEDLPTCVFPGAAHGAMWASPYSFQEKRGPFGGHPKPSPLAYRVILFRKVERTGLFLVGLILQNRSRG